MSSSTAVISGTGMSVPDKVVTNRDLEKIVDTSDEWITTRTGIRERRIAAAGEPVSLYASDAARKAMEAAGVTPEQIDLLILATVTPDMLIPATACKIQQDLGCVNAAAFDLSAGCSGFIYAQSVAKQFLLTGEAIDAATALRIGLVSRVHPADELSERVEEYARKFRHIPANQLALNKLLVNQAFENMGLRTTQLLGTFFDGVTRHTEEAYRWAESFGTKGFRQVIRERDRPFGDYGERERS